MLRRDRITACLLMVLCGALYAQAQTPQPSGVTLWPSQTSGDPEDRNYELPPGADPQNHLGPVFVRHIAEDQKHFWAFPTRLRIKDLKWIVPAAGATAALIASDRWISNQVPNRRKQLNFSQSVSDYGLYSLIGAGGAAYVFGAISKNDHMRETGLLAAEAAINATGVTYAVKLATLRQRPYVRTEDGDFFAGSISGNNSSFSSEHAAIAWSIASVVAHEYPGPLTKLTAYGLATLITTTRVTAQQHFPSDVLIGSVLGLYFGHEVFRAHHDPELGGAAWGNYLEPSYEPRQRDPRNMGSPYVPPDSWVYPLFDRLAALGVVKTAYMGIRPWTRMECARLLEEAGDEINATDTDNNEGARIYRDLSEEFSGEVSRLNGEANLGFHVDSVYARGTEISGRPLTDGYHFGQTIVNDYGRPYSSGFNSIAGLTAYAVAGPFSFSLQGEYQHSPGVPGYSAQFNEPLRLPTPQPRFLTAGMESIE